MTRKGVGAKSVSAAAIAPASHALPDLHAAIANITELRLAEEALRSSRQIIDGIMNAMPARVFWKDRDFVLLGL